MDGSYEYFMETGGSGTSKTGSKRTKEWSIAHSFKTGGFILSYKISVNQWKILGTDEKCRSLKRLDDKILTLQKQTTRSDPWTNADRHLLYLPIEIERRKEE